MATVKLFLCVAVFLFISIIKDVSATEISLTSSGRAVRGSNVTFTATVSNYTPGKSLRYVFHDNASPQHHTTVTEPTNTTSWSVEYPKYLYEPGDYTMDVTLLTNHFGIWIIAAYASTTFQLTDSLNGNLVLNQNDEDLSNRFVAVNKTVRHYIKLPENELTFLKGNSSTIATYWFIDCVPYGSTEDFTLNYTYDDTMNDHQVEAIVIANNEPLQPITTTTTTTTITTTTTTTPKPPPTTDKLPTTTDKLPTTAQLPTTTKLPTTAELTTTVSLTNVTEKVTKANETAPAEKLEPTNKTRTKRSAPSNLTCNNDVPIGKTYTSGRYQIKVSVREPISTINISGLNWIQRGDLLDLQVKYSGSPPFDYCIYYKLGQYNVTGNETCASKTRTIANHFPLVHYLSDSDLFTVVVVIENEIGKTVQRATINIYKSTVHAQLSVIVVPVFFSLVAVILVVFGIAYYQHRSRHTVEVADFDFGQAHPDFKTFRERLRDSFRNAFNFRNRDDTDPLTSNSRYDSM